MRAKAAIAIAAGAGLAAAVFASSPSAKIGPSYGKSIRGSLLGEPVHTDPTRARSHEDVELVSLVFDTLYKLDPRSGQVVPMLAADRPVLSDDGLTASILLRPGTVFHNRADVTGADVVDSLERVRRSPAGWLLAPVKSLSTADADGLTTVTVALRYRLSAEDIAATLSAPATSITPKGKAPGRKVVGSGAFRLRRIDRSGKRVSLEAWSEHHAGRTFLNGLRLYWYETRGEEAKKYETGQSYFSLRGSVAFPDHQPKYRTKSVEGPASVLMYVGFGKAHRQLLSSREFRRALSLSLSRSSMRRIGSGEQIVPTVFPAAQALGGPATPASNLLAKKRAALSMLAAVRNNGVAVGPETSLEIIVNRSRPEDRDVADKVVAGLYKIGVGATITELGAREYSKRSERGNCDLFVGQLAPQTARAVDQVAAAFAAGGDGWAADAMRNKPLGLAAAQRVFAQRLPVIPVVHRAIKVHHRSNLHDLRFEPTGRLALEDAHVYKLSVRNR